MTLATSGDIVQHGQNERRLAKRVGDVVVSELTGEERSVRNVETEIESIRQLTEVPQSTSFRRLLWFWVRIYVRDGKERVNIRLPIPIPGIGALFPQKMRVNRALMLYEMMQKSSDPVRTMREFAESTMAVEFIRVEDGDDELVVIGID
ncbi:hypothetical protein KFU94_48675 [Chloroflexi bacterium TSY]|nr:hypothetical protein [Chloroflexi bacterium TSY]